MAFSPQTAAQSRGSTASEGTRDCCGAPRVAARRGVGAAGRGMARSADDRMGGEDAHIGARKKSGAHVDRAIGVDVTTPATRTTLASGLPLPRLVSHECRLYAVVDQIADKGCATMRADNDRSSNREQDPVDLVVLAIIGSARRAAISTEASHRRREPFAHLVIPQGWGGAYAKKAQAGALLRQRPHRRPGARADHSLQRLSPRRKRAKRHRVNPSS